MAYSPAFVQAQLSTIASKLPRIVGVSTDVIHNPRKSTSHEAVTIYRNNGSSARIDISKHASAPNRAVEQLRKNCDTSDEAGLAIKEAALNLFAANPRGSWCVDPQPAAEPVVLSAFADPSAFEQASYALFVVDRLAELMPGVAKIVTENANVSPAGGGRVQRRTWVRFLDAARAEMAAIDTSTMTIHARDALTHQGHDHLETNLFRLSYWAKQLGVVTTDLEEGAGDLALVHASGEVMSLLKVAVIDLGADELRLRPEQT